MPNLLIFAPCDNVLISKDTESVSLVVIMTQVAFPGPLPENLPENPHAPMRWFVFSQWSLAEDEVGRIFEQRIQLTRGQQIFFSAEQAFEGQAERTHHRMVGAFNSFPLIPPGECQLVLSLREAGNEEWQTVSTYPLLVTTLQLKEEKTQ